MKNIIIFLIVGMSMTTITLTARMNCINPDKTQKIVCDIYDKIKNVGFSIPAHESKEITDKGGAPTYGEITLEGALELLKELNLTEQDVFMDLGCGIGKFNVIVFLVTPAQKSIGVELSQTRYDHAQQAAQELHESLGSDKKRFKNKVLEFRKDDMLATPLDDATVIYMCSTCFAEPLLQKLNERFAQLPVGTRIISLKSLPPHEHLKLVKTISLPMTWSKSTGVNLYVRV
jgi:SAM-dependent methyltransferase